MTALDVDLQERLARRFGPGVADWCAGLPALTRSLALRWTLDLGEPFPGGNSWCRAVAPIVAITYLRRPGSQAAVAELLALSSE